MTTELIQRLVEKRANTWEQAKSLLDDVEEHGGDFTAEQEEAWQRLNADLDAKDARIQELTKLEERNADADAVRAEYRMGEPPAADNRPDEISVVRSIAKGERRSADLHLTDAERRAYAGLSVGTDSAGGDTVPTSFVGKLYEHMIEVSAIRQTNVTVITTDSGEELQVPKTAGFSSATTTDEAATLTESEPSFGQVSLNAYKYGVLMQASSELLEDSAFDIVGFLARQAGRALGNKSGTDFITGAGTTGPKGVATAATVGVTGSTGVSGAFTYDNIVDLYFSVIAPYRGRASWLMSDASLAALRKLKDDNSVPLWQPSLVAGEPDSLFGKRIVSDTNMADPANAAVSVLFGDFSAYYIRDVSRVRFERSDDYAFNSDVVTFRAILRTDGDLIDTTGAVKAFKGGAAS